MFKTLPWLPCIKTCILSRPLPRNVQTPSSPIAVLFALVQTTTVEVMDDLIKHALPISRDLFLPTTDHLLLQDFCQGYQGARNPGRGGRGFPSRGGRGGRGGRYGAGRSTGVHYAEDETPPEPEHEESQPPDLDTYAEDQNAEHYDDSFYAGVPEYHTPPGHYEAYYDDTYKGPHPWGYNEDYGEY